MTSTHLTSSKESSALLAAQRLCVLGQLSRCGAIQRVFCNKTLNHYGKYKIKLFSRPLNKWVVIKIDDRIPCDPRNGEPLFAKPVGSEAWVMLLEKAFAKYCGSYSALDGGHTLWALEALTGDHVYRFSHESNGWVKKTLVHEPKKGVREVSYQSSRSERPLDNEAFFKLLQHHCKKGSVLECGVGSGKDTESTDGIVHGHAYSILQIVEAGGHRRSILQIVEAGGHRLLQLRNPWGRGEWTGKWSDKDAKTWEQYPKIAKACKWKQRSDKEAEDGMFWMNWKDFLNHFHKLGFVFRTTGFDDLALNSHEGQGCCGPVYGCCGGCLKFWCCCQGMKALCCAQASSADMDISGKVAPARSKR
eukprot:CAMPEP_0177786244 /NCGR_PEP_ID=MMETSP0491_2-20121128/20815_1 /TAXON_ID=63592 /ORGANISM="Tetraselmis chuii, Strain PLY429" /LENGTH=360 /DNA_ID=CAMNT_0019307433 /DNA_START=329 /DNA_END=1412 /DNA_ORIENTATION=-